MKTRSLKGIKAVLIGAGNVASHLEELLTHAGVDIVQKVRRRSSKGYLSKFTNINKEADLYIIAVNDDSIASVAEAMPDVKGLVVHTSGTADISLLHRFRYHGVFYPLQTIRKNKKIISIPYYLILEANTRASLSQLKKIASGMGMNATVADSEQRRKIHLAAVMINNFTNHLAALAFAYLKDNRIPVKALFPLVMETANRITTGDPSSYQTGPAVRHGPGSAR